MIGAIAGDIIGSVYEHNPIKTKEFPLFHPHSCFTDDSVLTLAVAKAILEDSSYEKSVQDMGRKHPDAGYGSTFSKWLISTSPAPYNSWGNGSAMRVSPVGFAFNTPETVLLEAEKSAVITHNHPEGIKGAQATALAVFLARKGHHKADIQKEIEKRFNYNLEKSLDQIRPLYQFDISCQGTVPQAMRAFLESESFEDAIRNAVSLGGDSDTLACIAGGIAEAYYGGIPELIEQNVKEILPENLWTIITEFYKTFGKR